MDATTILAIVCCAIVFCGWLLLPHSAAAQPRVVSREREPQREREPIPASA